MRLTKPNLRISCIKDHIVIFKKRNPEYSDIVLALSDHDDAVVSCGVESDVVPVGHVNCVFAFEHEF